MSYRNGEQLYEYTLILRTPIDSNTITETLWQATGAYASVCYVLYTVQCDHRSSHADQHSTTLTTLMLTLCSLYTKQLHDMYTSTTQERMQTALLALGADVCTAYSEAMKQGLTALESTHKAEHMSQPESVRCLLVYWLSPLHERPGFGRAPPHVSCGHTIMHFCCML